MYALAGALVVTVRSECSAFVDALFLRVFYGILRIDSLRLFLPATFPWNLGGGEKCGQVILCNEWNHLDQRLVRALVHLLGPPSIAGILE